MATQEQIQAIMKIRRKWQAEDDQRDNDLPNVFDGVERTDDLQMAMIRNGIYWMFTVRKNETENYRSSF